MTGGRRGGGEKRKKKKTSVDQLSKEASAHAARQEENEGVVRMEEKTKRM